MKREEIMETIKSLASSQGLYGRLYRDLMELDEDEYDEVMTEKIIKLFGLQKSKLGGNYE